jgi:hypothetical protein
MSQSQGSVAGQTNTDTRVAFGEGKTIDRLALQKEILKRLPKAENENNIILTLLNDAFWSDITADPRIVDAEGNPFKTFAAWFAFVLKDFPTSKEMFTKQVVKKLLSVDGNSVRIVSSFTGWSRGYVHDVNQERQGKPTEKQKRAARKTAAEKQQTPATPPAASPMEASAGTPALALPDQGSDESSTAYADKLVAAWLPIAAKCVSLIAEMSDASRALFLAQSIKCHSSAQAMTDVKAGSDKVAAGPKLDGAHCQPKPAAPKPAAPKQAAAS